MHVSIDSCIKQFQWVQLTCICDEKLNIVDAVMDNIVFMYINSVIVVFWFAYNKQFINAGGSQCQLYPPFHVWVTKKYHHKGAKLFSTPNYYVIELMVMVSYGYGATNE